MPKMLVTHSSQELSHLSASEAEFQGCVVLQRAFFAYKLGQKPRAFLLKLPLRFQLWRKTLGCLLSEIMRYCRIIPPAICLRAAAFNATLKAKGQRGGNALTSAMLLSLENAKQALSNWYKLQFEQITVANTVFNSLRKIEGQYQ